LVLAGFVFSLTRSYGTRTGGILLITAGMVMIAGTAAGTTLLPRIQDQYVVGGVAHALYVFMGGGAGVVAVGGYLFAISSRRKPAHYNSNIDDLR
jgi:hypothetical protein